MYTVAYISPAVYGLMSSASVSSAFKNTHFYTWISLSEKTCAIKNRKEKIVLARGCECVWLILCSCVRVTSESNGLWTSFRQQCVINHHKPGVIWVCVGWIQAWQILMDITDFSFKKWNIPLTAKCSSYKDTNCKPKSLVVNKWAIIALVYGSFYRRVNHWYWGFEA